MSRSLFNAPLQIQPGTITRALLNTATAGSALLSKVIAGSNVSLVSTGADAGTGDVTINAGVFTTTAQASSFTETATTGIVIRRITATGQTVTLPTAVGNSAQIVIKLMVTGTVTINTTSSQTIDGALTATLDTQYQTISLVSDGANWIIT